MINIDSPEMFKNSLLYKLGYRYEDFFPTYGGFHDVWHDPAVQNNLINGEYYLSIKPITTNPSLSISDQPFMAIMDDSLENTDTKGLPTYQLGFCGLQPNFNLQSQTSSQIVASNLPTKDNSPYFLIYSDIINTDYYTQETKTNNVAIVPKYFSGGDYIYLSLIHI